MYLLDTNVLSELMRPVADDNVKHWFMATNSSMVFLPVISLAEIIFGLERLPRGRRRTELEMRLHDLRQHRFSKKLVEFDEPAAVRCGEIRAYAQARGRPPALADAQIASIALTRSMTVATRDIGDFSAFGVAVVNPFEARAQP